jgi:hypothetical protein
MNLLFVAKTGVFEALTVGLSYLDKEEELETISAFGNIEKEKTGELIYLGKNRYGNDVYCVGNKNPDIVVRINQEIKHIVKKIDSPLKAVPVSVKGNEYIYILSRLAMLPLVGSLFITIAKSSTLKIKNELINAGKSFQENAETTAAAKPLKSKFSTSE